jgi:hypothetical protein
MAIQQKLEYKIVKYHEWRKKNKKKPITDLARWLRRLAKLSNNDPETAIEVMNVARENGWQGIFPLSEKQTKTVVKEEKKIKITY